MTVGMTPSGPTGLRATAPTLLTVGHGRADQESLAATLSCNGVQLLVDVRRFPSSRAHPHVERDALEGWLPHQGISYCWEPRLGGRRRLPQGVTSPDVWWRVDAFRAYAGYTRTPEFAAGLDDVLDQARRRTVAIMCSEAVWWRCHRRLIADVAVLTHGVQVLHIMPRGGLTPHRPAEGARVQPDGVLVWDDG